MNPSLSPHLRRALYSLPSPLPYPMARAMTRAAFFSPNPTLPKFPTSRYLSSPPTHFRSTCCIKDSSVFGKWVGNGFGNGGQWSLFRWCGMKVCCSVGGFGGGERGYRKLSRRRSFRKKKVKELELSVKILIEEALPNDPEILSIAEMLQLNAPMAMKLAFERLKDSEYKARDTSISDVAGFDTVELSLLLCNDEFIQTLNKDWRDEDHATDVLSMSQHIPELNLPILMLGDIVISVETAARQAEERGHTLLDEIRILLVHGLLHLLGFDHEISEEAEEEMEKEEETLLKNLGWKGKGLIKSAYDAEDSVSLVKTPDTNGTLLNSKSQISSANANAIREAMSRGVQVIIATGKARPGAINALKTVDLVGINGVLSESSPGVFLQAFLYSQEHQIPLVAFCSDRCLTLFDHPLVDSLHSVYHEPKKLVFLDTPDGVTTTLRPFWSEASGDHATVVQTVPDMLELVPHGTSKGNGVKLLLDHLGVTPNEIMAIGDGENDIEMLKLATLGVALSNGSDKTKAVADVIGVSNDEDGVADAIYRYAF
ncbi:hypothetical protein KSS87_016360 [Heliosperma pusillum]|nr:hypothetical protein KSS87_016360 [Heliosperma pusillum]